MKKQAIIPILILLFLIAATTLVVLYGKGYRFTLKQNLPKLSKTGLLVVNSTPNGAQVFIDDHLTTATDNTIDLTPGTYDIKIIKEGYFPWEKTVKIQAEAVTNAEARLFPLAPKLESIASRAIQNPLIDPSKTKIAFQLASESASRKNGIYILNMDSNNIPMPVLTLQSSSIQIADDTVAKLSTAELKWSPDGTQILAEIEDSDKNSTYLLLQTNKLNDSPQDVTAIINNVLENWNQQKQEKNRSLQSSLEKKIRKLIAENFSVISWSPDETKILYKASNSAELPLIIKPRRLSIDTLHEKRQIIKDDFYVYDTKEDTNMQIPVTISKTCEGLLEDCNLPLAWLPDSDHLIYVDDKKINIMDDDGLNSITVYAGPFISNYAIPWPDTSKIVILTNLNNPNVSPTLYTIGLK